MAEKEDPLNILFSKISYNLPKNDKKNIKKRNTTYS